MKPQAQQTQREATRIKCCGMFRPEDIAAVNAAKPDYCGFIVNFPRSHRSVTADELMALTALLASGIDAVGVFVDEEPPVVAELAQRARLALVQLHGHEDEHYLKQLRALTDVPIIKAFKVTNSKDLRAARACSADYVLLDNGYGTGEAFDWSLLQDEAGSALGIERLFFLAGGLTCENIPEAVVRFKPFAIDLSSGLETDRLKDPAKIQRAVEALRRAAPA